MKMKKLLKFMFWPLIMLKNILDANWWAEKIGNKTGAYEKAHNSKLANWSRSLTGWKWWVWQIVGGLLGVIVLEFILNTLEMTMLPWRH
jgi:hypothetical protein|tara:strand:- start:46 stop:312 length:267 start_codon:yes stop_codon:yes gene_type:complete